MITPHHLPLKSHKSCNILLIFTLLNTVKNFQKFKIILVRVFQEDLIQ